jgi:hypothetical protein
MRTLWLLCPKVYEYVLMYVGRYTIGSGEMDMIMGRAETRLIHQL